MKFCFLSLAFILVALIEAKGKFKRSFSVSKYKDRLNKDKYFEAEWKSLEEKQKMMRIKVLILLVADSAGIILKMLYFPINLEPPGTLTNKRPKTATKSLIRVSIK